MPNGSDPFCGGSGPTWNDAMMAGEIMRRQQQEGTWPRRTVLSPRRVAFMRIKRNVRAALFATAAVVIFIGGLCELAIGQFASSIGPFVFAVASAVWASHQRRAALSANSFLASPRPGVR